jgi:hypothetical protein
MQSDRTSQITPIPNKLFDQLRAEGMPVRTIEEALDVQKHFANTKEARFANGVAQGEQLGKAVAEGIQDGVVPAASREHIKQVVVTPHDRFLQEKARLERKRRHKMADASRRKNRK